MTCTNLSLGVAFSIVISYSFRWTVWGCSSFLSHLLSHFCNKSHTFYGLLTSLTPLDYWFYELYLFLDGLLSDWTFLLVIQTTFSSLKWFHSEVVCWVIFADWARKSRNHLSDWCQCFPYCVTLYSSPCAICCLSCQFFMVLLLSEFDSNH